MNRIYENLLGSEKMAKIKNYFPGGNTSKGFYSYYRYIMSQHNASRIYCLKGGPGTGKSTIMKDVGKYYYDKGYDVELHHCSSDNNSLDGVVIRELNAVILDGTAPHVVDPINPGAVDEIVNLGDCWNKDGFSQYKDKIIFTNKEVGSYFKKAYKYIAASKLIYDDLISYYKHAQNWPWINQLMLNLKEELIPSKQGDKHPSDRHMFATAFTPNGIISYIENLTDDMDTVIVLQGYAGTGYECILNYLYEEAMRHGYSVEVFHNPLRPDKPAHIIIPELSTAVVSSSSIYAPKIGHARVINLNSNLNNNILLKKSEEIAQSESDFFNLLNTGLQCIKKAKSLHDVLEESYIPNMDYDKVSQVRDRIINEIDALGM